MRYLIPILERARIEGDLDAFGLVRSQFDLVETTQGANRLLGVVGHARRRANVYLRNHSAGHIALILNDEAYPNRAALLGLEY